MPQTPVENLDENQTLIDVLLAEQRDLTAVERFSGWHHARNGHSPNGHYRNLLPLTAPKSGEQYAFEVDLDKCSGCKACVTACHSLNGLEENEVWRQVGLLVSQPQAAPAFQQHITTACHHCVEPGCLDGCPVLAYDKDPVTGIVRHLDDQCIGCQYCVMKCPYEVPKYSSRLGIVRKCDMCTNRLAAGEAPACVQACPSEAIRITLVEQPAVRAKFLKPVPQLFLPASPDPRITLPTTRFISKRALPSAVQAADHNDLRLDHSHWPLVIMLVISQGAAGLFLAGAIAAQPLLRTVGVALFAVGMAAAFAHLGQPTKAWRAFLGWRKSWLSRELIAFHLFLGPALLTFIEPQLSVVAAMLGMAAVFTSTMVYVDTRRAFWSARFTFGNFFGTAALLGASLAAATSVGPDRLNLVRWFAATGLAVRVVLFAWRKFELGFALKHAESPIHFNARIQKKLLPWAAPLDAGAFVAATVFGTLAVGNVAQYAVVWGIVAALLTLGSEILNRWIFFTAGASKRMPGGVAA